jgi:hypothetical protein
MVALGSGETGMPDGEPRLEAPLEAAPRKFGSDAVQLLRTTQAIQYQLSQMADQKANMLLAITFVVFSLMLGQTKAGTAPSLPLLILGGFAFVAATLAVLAVQPSVKTPPAVNGPGNLVFFGSFSQMSEKDFVKTLVDSIGTNQEVFEIFAHDIYQNGRVLAAKKYRLLGYAYRVMLTGLFASFAAFVIPFAVKWMAP